ncbi:MAG: SsrA-binding protein SmpB [Campylobacteraceae bacterium]|nr:SsrA-binding protein SmpB [Campylobacteraceae bacterium]MBT3882523.1 SsrA-binding protein SmpB [Campylobacteraceae bacterium]MBT4031175.1 SsrA-binding protein SmpB [Campylobacteraceae bacterium]MBT4572171.1 SsrA-binding protein SmpB [Campylobacteraceae bacterium]MBT4707592.1 SsrA-binding protein SmpB [Campylobacteraceae bacterium]
MAKKKESSKPTQFLNKKAGHEFFILEKYEAGIQLQGSEIKAIREARVNLKESFVRIIKDEVFLLNAHITHLSTAHATYRPEEKRDRKLLLHRNEIEKLAKKVERDGLTIVVTKMYINARNLVKVQIALAQGKKLHDKRNDLKQKTMQRETQQALKNFR